MQKAAKGRIVHVLVDPAVNNGDDTAVAVISRVWSDTCVNLRVLYDGPPNMAADFRRPEWLTSFSLHESREALEAHAAERQAEADAATTPGAERFKVQLFGAFWPPRV